MANWIAGAIKRPGAFKAKARAAGMGTQAYARKASRSSTVSARTKRQAQLALTLSKMRARK